MPIWDSLHPEDRRKHIHASLTPGRALQLRCDFTTPPKDKYLVLACVEPEPLFLVINSKINELIQRRAWLLQCQVRINQEDHHFLQHHSYIDCTNAYNIALGTIYDQIESDIGRLKG